jgi:hypothetical protein
MPYPRRLITCPWCNHPVQPNAPRMRLHQSETTTFSGNTLATFHPDCGDALLDMLEERTAQSEAA